MYLSASLVFHQFLELLKLSKSFILGLQEEDPSLPQEIIDEEDILKDRD
jgi:hypothetical protein